MARSIARDGRAYRAVITITRVRPGKAIKTATLYEGPYATPAAALARITRARTEAEQWSMFADLGSDTVTGYVEQSTTTWERV